MSVTIRGDGTLTSSIAITGQPLTFKDTIPETRIYMDAPNAVRVISDGGPDYVYRRGKPRTLFSLTWAMLPKDELKTLQALWADVEMHHWFTVQTTDLSDGTAANPLKNEIFNINSGTSVFARGSYDGATPFPGTGTNWIVIGKYLIWTLGANAGVKSRVVDFFSDGSIEMESALTIASGNKFFIGYPARFTGPLTVSQYGNIRTHYNVTVDCEVVIF